MRISLIMRSAGTYYTWGRDHDRLASSRSHRQGEDEEEDGAVSPSPCPSTLST